MKVGKYILAGLFTGIIASIVILAFNWIYRSEVDLIAYAFVMPLSIFFFFPCINLVAGGIYFLFIDHWRRGRALYMALVLLITAILILFTYLDVRPDNPDAGKLRGLLLGLEVIEGLMAAFLIPFFGDHPKLFLTDKDIRGEE